MLQILVAFVFLHAIIAQTTKHFYQPFPQQSLTEGDCATKAGGCNCSGFGACTSAVVYCKDCTIYCSGLHSCAFLQAVVGVNSFVHCTGVASCTQYNNSGKATFFITGLFAGQRRLCNLTNCQQDFPNLGMSQVSFWSNLFSYNFYLLHAFGLKVFTENGVIVSNIVMLPTGSVQMLLAQPQHLTTQVRRNIIKDMNNTIHSFNLTFSGGAVEQLDPKIVSLIFDWDFWSPLFKDLLNGAFLTEGMISRVEVKNKTDLLAIHYYTVEPIDFAFADAFVALISDFVVKICSDSFRVDKSSVSMISSPFPYNLSLPSFSVFIELNCHTPSPFYPAKCTKNKEYAYIGSALVLYEDYFFSSHVVRNFGDFIMKAPFAVKNTLFEVTKMFHFAPDVPTTLLLHSTQLVVEHFWLTGNSIFYMEELVISTRAQKRATAIASNSTITVRSSVHFDGVVVISKQQKNILENTGILLFNFSIGGNFSGTAVLRTPDNETVKCQPKFSVAKGDLLSVACSDLPKTMGITSIIVVVVVGVGFSVLVVTVVKFRNVIFPFRIRQQKNKKEETI